MSALTVVETDLAYAQRKKTRQNTRQSRSTQKATVTEDTRNIHDHSNPFHRARADDLHAHDATQNIQKHFPTLDSPAPMDVRARSPRLTPIRARARISTIQPCARWRPAQARRRDATTRLHATSRRRATRDNTYLDLGRLEGGDAGDEGGREEGRHFQGNARCANMTTATTTTRARSMRCDGWMKMDGWVRSIRRCDRDRDGVSNPHAIDRYRYRYRYRYRSTVPIAIDARDDKIARRHATGR